MTNIMQRFGPVIKRSISSTSKKAADDSSSAISSAFYGWKEQKQQAQAELEKQKSSTIAPQFVNSFSGQTTYDPFDFSIASLRYKRKIDNLNHIKFMQSSSFNAPEINPADFFCLPHMLSKYLSTSGQIEHRSVTGLTPKKQKQMAKAIKRARAFGFISSVAKDVTFAPKRGKSL